MKTALSNLGQMLGVTKTNLISDNNGTSRVLIITLYRTLIGAGQRGSAPPNLAYTANFFTPLQWHCSFVLHVCGLHKTAADERERPLTLDIN